MLNRVFILLTGLLFVAQSALANDHVIGAIIIDDLGYNSQSAERIAAMPFEITCAVLPEAPSSLKAANILAEAGKELMLHLPMQGRSDQAQEQSVLTADMSELEFKQEVQRYLGIFPSIAGLNNHQGSVLTKASEPMHWLMEELRFIDDFYFIDSRTTNRSLAIHAAQLNDVPFAIRDIFLDHERNTDFIHQQLQRFIATAKRNGMAIAIGHPYRETLSVLEAELPKLKAQGIELVPASQLVKTHMAKIQHEASQADTDSRVNEKQKSQPLVMLQ